MGVQLCSPQSKIWLQCYADDMKAYFIKWPLQKTGCQVAQEVVQVTQKGLCLENHSHSLRGKVRKKIVLNKSSVIGMITVASTSGMLRDLTNALSIHSCHSPRTAGLNHGATPGIPAVIHWAGPQWQKEIFTTRSNNKEHRTVTPWMGVDEAWSYFFPPSPRGQNNHRRQQHSRLVTRRRKKNGGLTQSAPAKRSTNARKSNFINISDSRIWSRGQSERVGGGRLRVLIWPASHMIALDSELPAKALRK